MTAVLHQGQFFPAKEFGTVQRHFWLSLLERGGIATPMQWVEAEIAGKYPTIYRTAPQPRTIQAKMSIVPTLRSLGLGRR